jgi:hypothetical protein
LVFASGDGAGLKFFERSASTFTAKTVPSNFDLDYGDCAIAADGSYVAAASGQSTPYGRIWHNNAGTLSALSSVGSFDTNHRACAVSSTGQYVAFLGRTTLLRIKVRSGAGNSATFSDMTLASQPASGAGNGTPLGGLAFSPDDTYLAVSPVTQTNQTIYKWDSSTSTYVQLSSPFVGALPDNTVHGCTFSHQGDFLAIGTSSKTFFYQRSGDTFTSVANVTGGYRGSFHPSGDFYLTGSGVLYRKNSPSSWSQVTTITAGIAATFSPLITL